MNIQITRKDENKLLRRMEVEFVVLHQKEKAPSREESRGQLASNLQVAKELVIIDNQKTKFGKSYTVGYAKVYQSKDDAIALEPDFILIRHGLIEKKVE